MVRIGVLCAFLFAFFSSHLWAQGTGDWSGRWDTYWRDGEARMLLQQQGGTDGKLGGFTLNRTGYVVDAEG